MGLLNWPVVLVALVVAYTIVCKNIGASRLCAVLLWPGMAFTMIWLSMKMQLGVHIA